MTDGIGTDRPASSLDREQIAHLEVGHTNISPRLARVMVVAFLAALAVLPAVELLRGGTQITISTGNAGGADVQPVGTGGSAWRALVQANRGWLARLNAFENALEDQSVIGRALRPPTQFVLSKWLGAGNERVYVGRDGWLFYRPDVEYVTGVSFLDPEEHEQRVAAASEYETPIQPDPRPAILRFTRELEARGITLVIVPIPVKPTIHPERLTSVEPDSGVLQNAAFATFVDELRKSGVLVFDPSEEIVRSRADGIPQYLATDTHWRPETMVRVAAALAEFIEARGLLPAFPFPNYTAERREARQTGDTTSMLDLPEGQSVYPPERVTLRFIADADGNPWRSSRDADVLLLGDSFTNIYSLKTMGWGEGAGFAEQLSFALQRSVDRIVQNDQGAYATRELLAREPQRLAGKRVVVWQFAARELAVGDWKIIDLPQ